MLKKVLIIIISSILICLICLGIIGYYVEKDKSAEINDANVNAEEKVEQIVEEEKLEVNIDEFDIYQIDGYTPGEDLISLPYSIPNKNMDIISIGKYSGKFIEDGSDSKKDNIIAIIVKNTSEEVIDYGEINMKIRGKSDTIKFELTNLKPGACALIMESSGSIEFNPDDKYIYSSSKVNMISELSTMDSQINITTEDKKITVENLSQESLNTVYVYYKTVSPGNCYLGGITYRAKFENVESGKSVSVNTLHFNSITSEILKVESVEE